MLILHADLDAFYASVEMRRHPELKLLPMWVGGGHRGVVLSANYAARTYGVRGGMPAAQAQRLCPNGVAVRPDHAAYARASEAVAEIFESITPWVEMASIDEAYLDISGAGRLFGEPEQVGEELRRRILDAEQLPCSVGIGPNRLVAKMASSAAKPDGLRYIPEDKVTDFLHPLPVEDLHGVGAATAERLHQLGIHKVGELANVSLKTLQRAFGPKTGQNLLDLAWGHTRSGEGPVASPFHEARQPDQSIGNQETFYVDTDDEQVISDELLRVSSKVAHRLRQAGKVGKTVNLNLRFSNFSEISKSTTLSSYTDVTIEIHQAAIGIYRKLNLNHPRIRRVGVRVSDLSKREDAYLQPTLDAPEAGWQEAEKAVDKAIDRFGVKALSRAALLRR
ncbi:MAG: DNA polymerase IV [Propionibacteriaceae bacterium]|jgi:DNA polymerase-4|nr:DNA polymerase IV [Propionibacteriaceae bacterium]